MADIFGIARTALQTYQRALAVTGNNLANAGTPGYDRQTVELSEIVAGNGGGGGVTLSITRNTNNLAESQVNTSTSDLGQSQTSEQALTPVQSLLGNSAAGTGIGAALTNFYAALSDVSNNPGDSAARAVLFTKAQTLTKAFNTTASQLTAQRAGLDQQLLQVVTDINGFTTQIASLNSQIAQQQAGGTTPNALLDQRTNLLTQLSNRIGITTVNQTDGSVTVSTGNGQVLVNGGTATALTTTANGSNAGLHDVYNGSAKINSVLTSGVLKGLLDARDTTISGIQTNLDTLASNLVSTINTQHQQGYDLNNTTGNNFFTPAGTTAATISVAIASGTAFAASSTAAGVPGNGANALLIVGTKNSSIAGLGNVTFGTYYQNILTNLGSTLAQATQNSTVNQATLTQAKALRDTTSGVSTDEELVNMLNYQRAYQTAGKLVQVADQLTQTLLAMKQ